ncbi:MAG: 50S ribosomal protein L18 [Thermoprotei archaeon]|nr:MAG: 50S ribosomal protein L18 [Thermoprotei archaeon]
MPKMGARYKIPFKRRRKCLTNYKKRRALILSGKPRLVVRKSNKNIFVQVITAEPQGDVTLVSAHSKQLVKNFKWKAYTRNIPTAYLLGLIAGFQAMKKNIGEAILDIGLHRSTKGNIIYAAVKGALDAGLKIPVREDMLPGDDRISGKHIAKYAQMLKEIDPEKYDRQFSSYLKRGLPPEELPNHFAEIKEKIIKFFSA